MKKTWKIARIVFLLGISMIGLTGCNFISSLSIANTTTADPAIETTTAESDLTLRLNQIYNMVLAADAFDGTYEEWLASVQGPQGESGKEVILQVADGSIQWQYSGDAGWTVLISLIDLTGADGLDGNDGADGKEVIFQVADGQIQWQYVGEAEWTDLIALATLTGTNGSEGADGTDGKTVTFQISGGYIQWRYVGDPEWTNLIELRTIFGPKGDPGDDGLSAYEIYLKYHPDYLGGEEQWIHDLVNGTLSEMNTATITFESNGGSAVSPISQEVGSSVLAPADPSKAGFSFEGWYSDETLLAPYVFSSMPSSDLTLYASWIETIGEDDPGDYAWTLKADDTYEVSGYTGTNMVLVIPSTYLGKAVTSIGASAFSGSGGISSITIPSSVTIIGSYAFFECTSLTSFTFETGSQLISIGQGTFSNCSSLASIAIPSTVTSIERYAFYYCPSLSSITIPLGVTSIGEDTFAFCSSLTSITIPSSVISIGYQAFWGCTNLLDITIPASVTSIAEETFSGCLSLLQIIVDAENGYYSSENGVLFNKQMTQLVAYPAGKAEVSYQIPSSVNSIKNWAFHTCAHLTSIEIPSGITIIGRGTFSGCSGLTGITIPSSVTSVDYRAFENCSGMTSISIPSTVTSLGGSAFSNCSSLSTITFEAGSQLTNIGMSAFYGCSSLKSITIPSGVTNILHSTFNGCSSLATLTIPSSVSSIGNNAFQHCISLTSITIPSSVTSIASYAFLGCISLTIYTPIAETEKPIGWDSQWNPDGRPVVWGARTITFETNGGSAVPMIIQAVGAAVTEPIDPTKEGFVFSGWYSDDTLLLPYSFSTMPAINVTVYAKWDISA